MDLANICRSNNQTLNNLKINFLIIIVSNIVEFANHNFYLLTLF